MTINILLVVLFISAIVISILVLLQNKGGDMGSAFGGGSNTLFGARGSADFLSRATSITATIFFLSALALAYIYANQGRQSSDSVIQAAQTTEQLEQAETATDAEVPPVDSETESETETDVPAVPE